MLETMLFQDWNLENLNSVSKLQTKASVDETSLPVIRERKDKFPRRSRNHYKMWQDFKILWIFRRKFSKTSKIFESDIRDKEQPLSYQDFTKSVGIETLFYWNFTEKLIETLLWNYFTYRKLWKRFGILYFCYITTRNTVSILQYITVLAKIGYKIDFQTTTKVFLYLLGLIVTFTAFTNIALNPNEQIHNCYITWLFPVTVSVILLYFSAKNP